MNRWEIVEIPLERNPKDNRRESWKIQGSHTEWSKIPNLIKHRKRLTKKIDKLRIMEKLHSNYGVDCVEELNKKRLSLGFIKPEIISYELVKRKKHEKTIQTTIFESINQKEPFLTIHNYDVQPRIKYRCLKCIAKNPHNQQIIE